jgi:hypothetical protein
MIIRNIVVAVLCTFCLTAVLFTAIPVNSTETVNSTKTASSIPAYNPWADVNHDGRINILDLIEVALGLGSSGNPSLNVTITRHATLLRQMLITQIPPGWGMGGGNMSLDGYTSFSITIKGARGLSFSIVTSDGHYSFRNTLSTNCSDPYVTTQPVTLPYVAVELHNPFSTPQNVYVDLYAIA